MLKNWGSLSKKARLAGRPHWLGELPRLLSSFFNPPWWSHREDVAIITLLLAHQPPSNTRVVIARIREWALETSATSLRIQFCRTRPWQASILTQPSQCVVATSTTASRLLLSLRARKATLQLLDRSSNGSRRTRCVFKNAWGSLIRNSKRQPPLCCSRLAWTRAPN